MLATLLPYRKFLPSGGEGPDCKILFLHGELFVVNGCCAEMKAEYLRKFRKFGVSRWSEMAFSEFSLARPNT